MQLREKLPQFEALGVRVVCVVQGTAEEAQQFCARHGLMQGCIGDPGKESYRAMGFGRTSWKAILFASSELKRRRVEANEYKRYQAPPALKVTPRAFGTGWRMPIARSHQH